MSTAVMPQSAMYDFGDMFKNIPGTHQTASDVGGNHLAVGSAPLSPRRIRFALSRMSTGPGSAASLVTSLLDNLQTHHRRLERTQSAPAPPTSAAAVAVSNSAAAAAAVNTSRYKTELCRPYEEFGVCKYGDKCQFAHGMAELRSLARHPKYKTELCRTYHTVGFCPYGPRCHFVHNEEEARQHNRAVAAMLAVRGGSAQSVPAATRRPSALSPALSLDSHSPSSSLSQSPTSSMGSFFSSEPELHSPVAPALDSVILTTNAIAANNNNNNNNNNNICSPPSPSSDSTLPDFRLPVFNRLSASVLALGDLML